MRSALIWMVVLGSSLLALAAPASAQDHEGGGGFLWSATAAQSLMGAGAYGLAQDEVALGVTGISLGLVTYAAGPLLAATLGDDWDPRPAAMVQLGLFGGASIFAATALLQGEINELTWLAGAGGLLVTAPFGLGVDREGELFPTLFPFLVTIGVPIVAALTGLILIPLGSEDGAIGFGVAWSGAVFATTLGVGIASLLEGPTQYTEQDTGIEITMTPTGFFGRF